MPPIKENGRIFSPLEYAPSYVVYALHPFYAVYLALRYRSTTLPAISNPKIRIGGIAGESKTDLFALVGPYGKRFFAPFITVEAHASIEEIRMQLNEVGLSYPLVAKPDIGRNGRGVKIVQTETELLTHLARFPSHARMTLQRYVKEEGEAGIFYVRKPSEPTGRITSLTLKYFPRVIGDGTSTLRQLILKDPRASRIAHIYIRRHRAHLEDIIPEGTVYRLVSVGNHVRGALFVDGAPYITKEMVGAFDRIAKDIDGFYFGRFDVRFNDIADLQRGERFTILEYNGASSEPTHVWDRHTSVWHTYTSLLYHWRLAFEIGAEVRAQGVPTVPFFHIVNVQQEESALIKQYPDEE